VAQHKYLRPEAVTRVPVAQGGPGSTILLAAVAGKRHYMIGGWLTLSADGSIKWTGSVSGDLTGAMDWLGKGGIAIPEGETLETAVVRSGVNEDLNLVTTGGAARGVVLIYTE
jgi:hypothetical protein